MPGTVRTSFIDHTSNLQLEERNGVIRSLTRRARVDIAPWPNDYSVLSLALSQCPYPYTGLPSPFNNLVLVQRTPRVIEGDPGWVDVDLKYDHILDGPNQLLDPNNLFLALIQSGNAFLGTGNPPNIAGTTPNTGLYGQMRSSIVEKTTNFFYPDPSNPDPKTRIQILTSHTYAASDTGAWAQSMSNPGFPHNCQQGGEVSLPFPQANYKIQAAVPLSLAINDIFAYTNLFIGNINQNTWLEKPPFTWICSEVSWSVLDSRIPLYALSWEFQYSQDTWNPVVAFNDQRTGRPPASIRPGTINLPGTPVGINNAQTYTLGPGLVPAGYWVVPQLVPVDFDGLFGTSLFEQTVV